MMAKLLSCVLGLTALIASDAHAWVALAFDEYSGATYIAHAVDDAARAETLALERCNRPVTRARCVMIDPARQGGAMVVVRGIDPANGRLRVATAMDTDPGVARLASLSACRRAGNVHCTVVDAAWDPGQAWAALAKSSDAMFFSPNADSPEAARAASLAGCEALTAQRGACKVFGPSVSSDQAWVVFVESKDARYFGHDADRSTAEAEALEACRVTSAQPEACRVTRFHQNTGPRIAPTAYLRLEAEARLGAVSLRQAREAFNASLAARTFPVRTALGAPVWYAIADL